jgi:hypothetical protein
VFLVDLHVAVERRDDAGLLDVLGKVVSDLPHASCALRTAADAKAASSAPVAARSAASGLGGRLRSTIWS